MAYTIENHHISQLLNPVVKATETLARLDERIATSPLREGWLSRCHIMEAAASLWLEGELVTVEDLILHDAHMDIHTPSHALTRAHGILRSRRQISSQASHWALSDEGLAALWQRSGSSPTDSFIIDPHSQIDTVIKEWARQLCEPHPYPALLVAGLAYESWGRVGFAKRYDGIIRLLVAAYLRQEGVSKNLLAWLSLGLKSIPHERRYHPDPIIRIQSVIDAIAHMAVIGMKEHARLLFVREELYNRIKERRTNSRLPQLIELVLSSPLVTTTLVEKQLKITQQGALTLLKQLKLREVTGRGRYRAWAASGMI